MKPTVENAKLLATLIGITEKQNSKAKFDLYEQIYSALQKDINNQNGVQYLNIEGIEKPIPIKVFRGDKGIRGPQGPAGPIGIRGETGPAGPQGERGEIGPVGPRGLQGERGPQGEQGIQGFAGKDGKDADIAPVEKKFQELYDDFVRRISAQVTRMAYARGDMGGGGSGEVNLHKMDDVDYASLKNATNGQTLVYNATTGKWQANTVSSSGASIATIATAELGNLTEDDIVVIGVTGDTVTSNTVGVLTSALNNALARIEDLEARLTAAGIA